MRILHINSVCGVTSTGRITADIDRRLRETGHESQVAFARKQPRHCPSAVRFGGNVNFLSHVLYTFITDRHGFASRRATKKLLAIIDRFNPDLIHLQVVHGYYLNIELLFDKLKVLGRPVVWTFHDCWSFTGHCAYFDYVHCDRWRTECHDCPAKGDYPISLLMDASRWNHKQKKRLFLGLPDLTIVTPSAWLADLTRQSFLRDYPVTVIPNGIDLDCFQPRSDASTMKLPAGKSFLILGVANVWTRRKGLQFFLELSSLLGPEDLIVLVGLPRRQAARLPANILSIERTDSALALAALYSQADVFVNPTLEDNFPTTNLEALACGTPVITFRTGGSVESVVDGQTGYVVEQGDVLSLLAQVQMVKHLGKACFSATCRQRALDLYDRDRNYQRYIALYESILAPACTIASQEGKETTTP